MSDVTTATSADASDGNFTMGTAAGVIAAVIGATVWAVITVVTKFQIGFMAVGVGFLVGYAIRKFGAGAGIRYGILGGALALLGCIAGNFFSTVGFIAQAESLAFFQVLMQIKVASIPKLLMATFDVMDLVFYGIAVYEGFKLSMSAPSSAT